MINFLSLFFIGLLGLCHAGKYMVTDEVWFDVKIADYYGDGQDYTGRFEIALFGETVPMTAMNFVSLARGYKKKDEMLGFSGSPIHRVVLDFVVQMGDITTGDGTGSVSIYGEKFDDENFELSHRSPGWVAMANRGADTNNSQFFILLTKARWLDQKHVVFGKVVRGFDVVKVIEGVDTDPATNRPLGEVTITETGVVNLPKKYELPEHLLDSTDDFTNN